MEASSTSSKPSAVSHSQQGRQSQFEKKIRRFGFVANNPTDQLKCLDSEAALETGEMEIKEVWFAGCHSGKNLLYACCLHYDQRMTQTFCTDIGGGAVSNDVEQSLSNITLRWMVREIVASGLSDIFDSSALARAKINLEPPQTNSEIEKDSTDALDPLHDAMQSNILWWLLEILPLPYSFQDMNDVWHTTYV